MWLFFLIKWIKNALVKINRQSGKLIAHRWTVKKCLKQWPAAPVPPKLSLTFNGVGIEPFMAKLLYAPFRLYLCSTDSIICTKKAEKPGRWSKMGKASIKYFSYESAAMCQQCLNVKRTCQKQELCFYSLSVCFWHFNLPFRQHLNTLLLLNKQLFAK